MDEENEDCLLEWFEKVAEDGKISEEALKNWAVQNKPIHSFSLLQLIEIVAFIIREITLLNSCMRVFDADKHL